MEESDWDAVLAVHLKGHYCCTAPSPTTFGRKSTGCRIINFSSVSGLFGNFGQANYAAAKAGIAGFSRVMALELAVAAPATPSPGALTRMTIPLRENRGETVEESDMKLVVLNILHRFVLGWPVRNPLASHPKFSRRAWRHRHHAATAHYQAVQKSEGVWSVEELDSHTPADGGQKSQHGGRGRIGETDGELKHSRSGEII